MAANRKHQKRSRTRVEGFLPVGNPDIEDATRQRARSSAAQPHVSKRHRRTRAERTRQAVRDQLPSEES